MKKLIALAGAAALMLASTGVAFGAFVINNQSAFQSTKGTAISNSGRNFASGMVSYQETGRSYSRTDAISSANDLTVIDPWSAVINNQSAFQSTKGTAISNSGRNFAGGMISVQKPGESYSYSTAGSYANWATVMSDCTGCEKPAQ